jgi:hypothetical protein
MFYQNVPMSMENEGGTLLTSILKDLPSDVPTNICEKPQHCKRILKSACISQN